MSERSPTATTSRSEVMPHEQYDHEGRLKIVIAGLDKNVRNQAIEAANAQLNEKIGDGPNGFGRFLRGVWKRDWQETKAGAKHVKSNFGSEVKSVGRNIRYGNLGREYYLTKYAREEESRIREHENLLEYEGVSAEEYRVATTMRFAHDYDELIHEGEHRHKVLDENEDGSPNEEGYELKQRIFRLIERYAAGNFASEDDFQEEKKRMMTELVAKGVTKDHIGEGLLYTDNLLQIAQNVKAMLDHRRAMGEGGGIDEILSNTDVVLGEARLGARTEVTQTRTERITKKLEGVKFVNEATVGAAVSVAYSVGVGAAKSAVGAAAKLIAPGAGSGVIAGFREARMLKEDRAQHSREMALGKGDAEKLHGRREALEAARYETKSASDLKDKIGAFYSDEGELNIQDKASFSQMLQSVAEGRARVQLSDRMNIDLISYSSVGEVEKERFDLDLTLAKAKCDIRNFLNEADDDSLKMIGIAEGDIPMLRRGEVDILDFVLNPRVDATEGLLLSGEDDFEGIAQKDRVYRKLRAKQIAKAAAKGTLLGMVIGATAQEVLAAGMDSRQGLLEGALGHEDHGATRQTLLDGAFSSSQSFELSGQTNSIQLDKYTELNLPEEFNVHKDGEMLSIHGPEGMRIEGLSLASDGQLTPESVSKLQYAGFGLSRDMGVVSENVDRQVTIGANEFVNNHKDVATKVTRDFWYDNGTPSPTQAEGSELGLQDPTVDSDGNFVLNISGMEERATSSSAGEINWREAAEKGDLKVAISASAGEQSNVFMVDIDEHGRAIIPEDSPIASMFSGDGENVEFHGKFTEVVEVAGEDEDGVTHIRPLATDTGSGDATFEDVVTTTTNHKSTTYTLDYTPPSMEVEVPPVIPVYGRRGLERMEPPAPRSAEQSDEVEVPSAASPEASGYSGYGGEERLREWEAERSPRLLDNPETELDAAEELKWYFDGQDGDYVEELQRRYETNPNLQNMTKDTELMINIPVAGAYEKDNIYNTLALYAGQDADALSKTQFVLSVNWKEGSDIDDVTATIAEIERARHDFPALNISFFREEWPEDFVKERGGAIYGRVIKSLYDTSLRAVYNANERGEAVDPLVVTNDADAKRISRNYLSRLIASRKQSPRADILMGKIHWGADTFKKYPGYGVVSSFFMTLEDRVRDMQKSISPASWGPNSAFKASTVAAVGGVNDGMGAGADSELGKRIIAARRPVNSIRLASEPYGNVSLDAAGGFVAETAPGAWVDSSPERLLDIYKKDEKPLTSAWDSFNNGGYAPRPAVAVGEEGEDIARDFDKIKGRVETQISGIISSGWSIVDDSQVIDAALETIFFKPDSGDAWTITGTRYNREFRFTPTGERELRAVLESVHTSVEEGLEMIDDVYSRSREAAAGA